MRTDIYQIADEPSPGRLSSFAVNPLWPFIAVMLGSTWLAWAWFAFNGAAVGSPSKRKEWLIIIGGMLGSVVIVFVLAALVDIFQIANIYLKYLGLTMVVWKLGVSYFLFILQSQTLEIYEYYGGKVRNGFFVLLAFFFLSPMILKEFPTIVRMIVS